jgi:hypothetical protein
VCIYIQGHFTKTLDVRVLDTKVVMTDCPSLVDRLLSTTVVAMLRAHEDLFDELVISDQHETRPSR